MRDNEALLIGLCVICVTLLLLFDKFPWLSNALK